MSQNGQTAFAVRFLKCVWPFWDIMHWRVECQAQQLNKINWLRAVNNFRKVPSYILDGVMRLHVFEILSLYCYVYMFVFHVMDNILKNISYNMTTVWGRTLLIIVVIKMYFLVAFQSLFSYFTKKKHFFSVVLSKHSLTQKGSCNSLVFFWEFFFLYIQRGT